MISSADNEYSIERGNWSGLDTRTDRANIPESKLMDTVNEVVVRGVLELREGSEPYGVLDISDKAGSPRRFRIADVGADEYCLIHKGTKILWAKASDASSAVVKDLAGADLVVADADSDIIPFGFGLGSGGTRVTKALFKQEAGCRVLEWNGTAWRGMNAGIDNAQFSFAVSEVGAGSNQQTGTFRIRLKAARVVNTLVTSESAPTGRATATGKDPAFYQQIALTLATNRIKVDVTFSGLDTQVTHWIPEVTKPLVFPSGVTNWSSNGNDPEQYFELAPVAISTSVQTFYLDLSEFSALVEADLRGYKPIPGHLISVFSSGRLFFSGVAPFLSRVYQTGLTGNFSQNGLYDPISNFWIAAEGDGSEVNGLSEVADHLVILKDTRTGIVPNKNPDASIVWRDIKLGAKHRSAVGAISKDLLIVLGQDGILRRFDGIQYLDRRDVADGNASPFSDDVMLISKRIDPSTVEMIWNKDRVHVLFGADNNRRALVLHPQEGYIWTYWQDLDHKFNAFANNGQDWIVLHGDKLWKQNPNYINDSNVSHEVWTDFGGTSEIAFKVQFADHKPKIESTGIIRQYRFELEAQLKNISKFVFSTNNGFIQTPQVDITPDPTEANSNFMSWYQARPDRTVVGNIISVLFEGIGPHKIRSTKLTVVERKGTHPWLIKNYDPELLKPTWAQKINDAGTYDRTVDEELDANTYDRPTPDVILERT